MRWVLFLMAAGTVAALRREPWLDEDPGKTRNHLNNSQNQVQRDLHEKAVAENQNHHRNEYSSNPHDFKEDKGTPKHSGEIHEHLIQKYSDSELHETTGAQKTQKSKIRKRREANFDDLYEEDILDEGIERKRRDVDTPQHEAREAMEHVQQGRRKRREVNDSQLFKDNTKRQRRDVDSAQHEAREAREHAQTGKRKRRNVEQNFVDARTLVEQASRQRRDIHSAQHEAREATEHAQQGKRKRREIINQDFTYKQYQEVARKKRDVHSPQHEAREAKEHTQEGKRRKRREIYDQVLKHFKYLKSAFHQLQKRDVDTPQHIAREAKEDLLEHGSRQGRSVYIETPYEEHVRVKRRPYDVTVRDKRSANLDYRRPRQVHQYEVYEATDEFAAPIVPPYEQMLAASADHYHHVRPVYQTRSALSLPYQRAPTVRVNHKRYHSRVNARPFALPSNQPENFKTIVPNPYYNPTALKVNLDEVSVNPNFNEAHVKTDSNFNSALKVDPKLNNSFVEVKPSFLTVPVNDNFSRVQVSPDKPPVSYEGVWSPVSNDPVSAALIGLAPVAAEPSPGSIRQADDQVLAAGHHAKHAASHGQEVAKGEKAHEGHHRNKHGKKSKGFSKSHHVDSGAKGHKTDEHHRKEYEDAQGKTKHHHDKADHKGAHEEEAHGARGAHFDEKKGHKKGHKTKGYHNKYHKDEFHKEHKFYDDFHKSGSHHRFGHFHAKHASNESGKKKAHHVDAGHDVKEHGKKGYSEKGHLDADHKGHKAAHGHEEHHHNHKKHAKKGGHQGGKHHAYQHGKKP